MPFNVGPLELIIILVIALLILGPGKLPEVGASLGKSIREFRKAATDVQDAVKVDSSPLPPPPVAPIAPPEAPVATPVATPAVAPPAPAPEPEPAAVATAAEPVANVLSDEATPNKLRSEQ